MPSEVQLTTKRDRYPVTANHYWEQEEPIPAIAGDIELRYYPEAQKLQVVRLIANRDKSARAGQIVTVDLSDLATSLDAMQLLRDVLDVVTEGTDRG